MTSYSDILLRNIGKVYYLPHKQSFSYRSLREHMRNLFVETRSNTLPRQLIFDRLTKIINSLNRLPTAYSKHPPPASLNIETTRTCERISTIVDILNAQSFVPKTILDIGAGNGDIIFALRNHYILDKNSVFAIDQKFPSLTDITSLTYHDNNIPLPDNSIDVIIMFAVLHHIPPDSRVNIMKEVSRVLTPGGYVIIREHDDNYDPDFYVFLDLLHLFWYISQCETVDPLYLLSRNRTTNLFRQVGLQPIYYSTYSEPNPQRIYHEIFHKSL